MWLPNLLLALGCQLGMAADLEPVGECDKDSARQVLAQITGAEDLPADLDPFAAIAGCRGPRTLALAAKGLEHPMETVRIASIRLLAGQDPRLAVPALTRVCTDPVELVRAVVPSAYARLLGHGALERIRRMAEDPEGVVRAGVAQAMLDLGWPEVKSSVAKSFDALVERLAEDSDVRVRRLMVDLCRMPVAQGRAVELLAWLASDPEEGLALYAVEALRKHSDAVSRIRIHLRDGDAARRGSAALALAELGAVGERTRIAELLDDGDPVVRSCALEALVKLVRGQVEAERTLARLAVTRLGDAEWWVRATAAETLARLGTVEAVGALIEACERAEERELPAHLEALRTLTGAWHPDASSWRRWMANGGKVPEGRVVPPVASVSAIRFCSIEDRTAEVVFAVDVSGSMEEGGDAAGVNKLVAARRELVASVMALAPDTRFTVLFFADDVRPWNALPVRASWRNKIRLEAATLDLVAKGGTATHAVLHQALDVPGVEAVFLLTDGVPSRGPTDSRWLEEDVLRHQGRLGKPVRLHTIALQVEEAQHFLSSLAQANGGSYQILR